MINKSSGAGFSESDISTVENTADAIIPHIPEKRIKNLVGDNS